MPRVPGAISLGEIKTSDLRDCSWDQRAPLLTPLLALSSKGPSALIGLLFRSTSFRWADGARNPHRWLPSQISMRPERLRAGETNLTHPMPQGTC